jgi:hypothetical protein
MIDMKKFSDNVKSLSVSPTHSDINSDELFKELDIPQRTQRPPSEELIARLNQLASRPPFSFTQKVKKNYPL